MGFKNMLPQKSAALRALSATFVCFSITSAPAVAQSSGQQTAVIVPAQFVEDAGASQRVDFAGKLRMLSQRVVAAGCAYQAGILPEQSGAVLQAATAEFDLILDALVNGNDDLGIIGAEERRKTLYGMNKLRELWEPMSAVTTGIAPNDGNIDAVADLATQSGPVLEMAKVMVSEISGQYANQAELLQSDALAIDVAGRQRMLSQRMSKNVCLVGSGINVDAAKAELAATAQVFETSLFALRDGMVQAGINPPPNDTIYEGLTVVVGDWDRLKPIVEATIAGGSIDSEQREIMFSGANQMTGNMNKVVGMYSEASKLGL